MCRVTDGSNDVLAGEFLLGETNDNKGQALNTHREQQNSSARALLGCSKAHFKIDIQLLDDLFQTLMSLLQDLIVLDKKRKKE